MFAPDGRIYAMGGYANTLLGKCLLWAVAGVVIILNVLLLRSIFSAA